MASASALQNVCLQKTRGIRPAPQPALALSGEAARPDSRGMLANAFVSKAVLGLSTRAGYRELPPEIGLKPQ